MKDLNKTEWGVPEWPEFREYSDGYTVRGFCRDLMDEDWLWVIAMFIGFAGFMLAGSVHAVASDIGLSLPPIIYLLVIFGIPGAYIYYAYHLYGKETQVTFLTDEIVLNGRTTGRLPVLQDQVTFRMRPHHKIRMHKRVKPNEVEKLQDYGEIVLEYGLRTYEVCNIANLKQAQVFTRVLNEAFKRSQALEPVPQKNSQNIDPDDLPE